jgi:hypothetical protein
MMVNGYINSTTQLIIERHSGTGATATTVSWEIIEATGNLTVQRGFLEPGTSPFSTDITITAVTLANSWAVIKSFGHYSWGFDGGSQIRANLTSTTNLRLDVTDGCYPVIRWQVVQDTDATVQNIAKTATATSDTSTITSVTTAATFLAVTGRCSGNDMQPQKNYAEYLSNSTTITYVRSYNESTWDFVTYVVSYASAAITVNRYQTANAGADTSKTTTVSITNTAKAFLNPTKVIQPLGNDAAYTGTANSFLWTYVITNSTTVTCARYAGNAQTGTIYFELAEFAGAVVQTRVVWWDPAR